MWLIGLYMQSDMQNDPSASHCPSMQHLQRALINMNATLASQPD